MEEATLCCSPREHGGEGSGLCGLEVQDNSGRADVAGEGGGGGIRAAMAGGGGEGSRALCCQLLLEGEELCLDKTQGTGVSVLGVALEKDVHHRCNGALDLSVDDPELTKERRATPKGPVAQPRLGLEQEAEAGVRGVDEEARAG